MTRDSDKRRLSRTVAFSLVELLVVVAIIMVLASLLLPTLARGKQSAERIRCVNNLRQLGLATHLYWDENGGNCFRFGGTSTNGGQLYWFGWIQNGEEGNRAFDASQGALYPYLRGRGIELCPSFRYDNSRLKLKATGATFGYGYNLSLSAPPNRSPVNLGQVLRPEAKALLADAAQINTWQAPASPNNPLLEEWYFIDTSTNQPNGHFRHHGKAEVQFCDGHAGLEKMAADSLDLRLPSELVGRLRTEILVLP